MIIKDSPLCGSIIVLETNLLLVSLQIYQNMLTSSISRQEPSTLSKQLSFITQSSNSADKREIPVLVDVQKPSLQLAIPWDPPCNRMAFACTCRTMWFGREAAGLSPSPLTKLCLFRKKAFVELAEQREWLCFHCHG